MNPVKKSPKDKVAKVAELTIPINGPPSAAEPISCPPIPHEFVEVLSPLSEQIIELSIPFVDIPNSIVVPNPIVDHPFDSLVPRVETSACVINTASEEPVPIPASAIEMPEILAEKTITVMKPLPLVQLSLSQRMFAKLTLSNIAYLLIIVGAIALAVYFLYRWKNLKSNFEVLEEIKLDEPAVIELRDGLNVAHLNQNKRNRIFPEFGLQKNQGGAVKENSGQVSSNTKENFVGRINKFFQKYNRMLHHPLRGFHHLHGQLVDPPLEKNQHKIERLIHSDAEPLIEQRERSIQEENTDETSLKSIGTIENPQQNLENITASNHTACHIISPSSIPSISENQYEELESKNDDPIHSLNQTGEERITISQGRDASAENTGGNSYPLPTQFHLEQNQASLRDPSISLTHPEDSLGRAREKSVNLVRYIDWLLPSKPMPRGLISNPNDSRPASPDYTQSPARTKQARYNLNSTYSEPQEERLNPNPPQVRRSSIATYNSRSASLDSTWEDSPSTSSRNKYLLQPEQVALFYESTSGSSSPTYKIISNK